MSSPARAPACLPLAVRACEYWLLRYRATWQTNTFTAFLLPVLYLSALGLGLGSLVDRQSGDANLAGLDYLVFLAPGLMAASAMQNAYDEAAWPVLGSIKYWKGYLAQQVSPLRIGDLLAGHVLFIALRLAVTTAAFALVATAFGAFDSWWALAAWPAAVLCGLAHATPIAAFAITCRTETTLAATYRFGALPMFLFSGAFFPVSQLPAALEVAAYLTPLWHGVDLCRDLALGEAGLWSSLGHVGYLVVVLAAGFATALRTYGRRLVG